MSADSSPENPAFKLGTLSAKAGATGSMISGSIALTNSDFGDVKIKARLIGNTGGVKVTGLDLDKTVSALTGALTKANNQTLESASPALSGPQQNRDQSRSPSR